MSVRTLLILGLMAAGPAFAGTPINEVRPLSADGQVTVENIKGRIVVRTWAQPQVRVTGTLGKGAEKLVVEGSGQSLHIEVRYPEQKNGWGGWSGRGDESEPTILEVTVPQRASLEIDSVSADVDVQQMAGRKLSVDSVSGNVVVTASSPGEASFENVSGDTTLRITTNKVSVDSVSGDISLQGGLSGDVSMESVSGNLRLVANALNRLDVSTVSGDATLQLALANAGVIKAESVSGNLGFTLPAATSANLHVETFSGDITSPVGTVQTEEFGPGKSLNARLGGGQGRISLESFSGDVTLQVK